MLELLEIFRVSMDRGLCGVYLKNELPHHHEPNVAHESSNHIFHVFFRFANPALSKTVADHSQIGSKCEHWRDHVIIMGQNFFTMQVALR